jgi:hypothetical protein
MVAFRAILPGDYGWERLWFLRRSEWENSFLKVWMKLSYHLMADFLPGEGGICSAEADWRRVFVSQPLYSWNRKRDQHAALRSC